MVCATQRSGSTLLCELLKETGVAGRPEEYYEATRDTGLPPHPGDYLRGLPPTGARIRKDPSPSEAPAYSSLEGLVSYREHLDRSFKLGTTDNGVFGAKLMWNQISELEQLAGQLPEYSGLQGLRLLELVFGDPAYIWVSRRDKIRQAVSMWRALQTRSWRRREDNDNSELVYRYEGIDHLARMFDEQDRAWARFFADHGIDALAISYEDDLERDRTGTLRRALTHLGLEPPAGWRAEDPIERQSDELSDQWVAQYHRDRAQRGSDSTSPVFTSS
ncbi:MAG: Stf0 family sulfotransferase [Solirubrobacteraceae bacterium]